MDNQKMAYYYALLRYCPSLINEEFANIGALMWIPEVDAVLWYIERRTERLERFWKYFHKDGFKILIEDRIYHFRETQKQFHTPLSDAELEELGMTAEIRFPDILKMFLNDPNVLPWSEIRSGISEFPAKRMSEVVQGLCANQPPEIIPATAGKFPELEWIWLNNVTGTGRSRYSALVPKGDRDNKQAYGYVSRLNDGRWQPEIVSTRYGGMISLILEPSEIYARKAVRREIEKEFKAS